MRASLKVIASVVLAIVTFGWALRLHEPAQERMTEPEEAATLSNAAEQQVTPEPAQSNAVNTEKPIDVADRARFVERAREFFAQAPALSPQEALRRADLLGQELTRIEQAGGMSAGETFVLRAGLIQAAEPDKQQQAAQLQALKQRYEIDRHRTARADAQGDPMFQLYKVRESEIVAEVMAMQTIPDGLTREEYLRRRLQQAREQLTGSM